MKLTQRQSVARHDINELINSGVTLTAKERQQVEEYIFASSSYVKPEHLNHYKTVAAIRAI